jgi:hypothetical protein
MGCALLDSRNPVEKCIALSEISICRQFHPSALMDIAVVIHDCGFSTFDLRNPAKFLSDFRFSEGEESVRCEGNWMKGTRLFGATVDDKFLIMCPYLAEPVLECYQLERDEIVGVRSDMELSLVRQRHSLTLLGGYGVEFSIPNYPL